MRQPSEKEPARFFDVVLNQRACRSFSPEEVPDSLIETVLEAATHAPSAENAQPWVFIVVRDPSLRAGIVQLTRRAWDEAGRLHSVGQLAAPLMADVEAGVATGFAQAPVMIIVCGDTNLAAGSILSSSVYPATQNLLLAASALGLGSALTTLATIPPDGLGELLRLPPHVKPKAVVPIGWPVKPLGPPQRIPFTRKAHRDRYGAGW